MPPSVTSAHEVTNASHIAGQPTLSAVRTPFGYRDCGSSQVTSPMYSAHRAPIVIVTGGRLVPYLYTLGRGTVAVGARVLWRPRTEGLHHVPAQGGAILASNHLSVADEWMLGSVVPRHIAFWAKSDYFTGGGISGFLMKTLMNGLGAIPVDRSGGRAAVTALDAAIPVLRAGGLVAIYPEGTRSPDGRLYRGRTGMARLAAAADVPIVPVGAVGTAAVQPIGTVVPHLGKPVVMRFGEPVVVDPTDASGSALRAVTDDVMHRIRELTGQEYVDRYAPARAPTSAA